jgi:uncharacterized protein YciI
MNFFCRLIAPRPTFAQDMSADEAQVMQEHAAYWKDWMTRGHVIGFGLVADPAGAYGIGIVDFDSIADAKAFTDGDPTIRSARGFAMEIHPMPLGFVRSGAGTRHMTDI